MASRMHFAALCSAVALGLLASCSSDEDRPAGGGDEYAAEFFKSTTAITDDSLAALDRIEDDGTMHFRGTPPALTNVAPRRVVLGGVGPGSPKGFLRFVRAVETDGQGLVLRTTPAPLQAAFRKLHVKMNRRVDDLAAPSVPWAWGATRVLAQGAKSQSKAIHFCPVNGDGNEESADDQACATGSLSGGFDFFFGLDVDWGDVYDVPAELLDCLQNSITGSGCSVASLLPEAKVGFEVNLEAGAKIDMGGVAFLPYEAPYTLGTVPLEKIYIGPLVFFPSVEVKATVSGKATSQFSFHLGAEAAAGMGVVYSSEHGDNSKKPYATFSFDPPSVDATLAASGRVEIGPELHLRLYDIAGPYAGIAVFADLAADQSKDPCWTLTGGVAGHFGFDIVTPDLPLIGHASLASWGKNYDLYSATVGSGPCKPLPGGGTPSPTGGDPDAANFSNPTFTPWSKTYSGAVEGHPFEGEGAQLEWIDAVPTIDGRFIVSGSDTKVLTKLSPAGDVVWAKRYLGPRNYVDRNTPELWPGRIMNMKDGTMLALAHPYTLLKLESSGEVVWAKELVVPAVRETTLRLSSVVAAQDGGFFVGGDYGVDRSLQQKVDAWLLRFDAKGNVVWSKRFGSVADGETLRALVPFEDGVVAMGSTWQPALSKWRAWAVRVGGAGNVVWSKSFDARSCGSNFEDSGFLTTGLVAKDGDLVVAGSIQSSRKTTLILKLKPDGTLAWFASDAAAAPVNQGPAIARIVALPTSGYLVTGTLGYSINGTYSDAQDDVWLGSVDGAGHLFWAKRFGGERTQDGVLRRSDTYGGLSLTRDGGVFLVGYTDSLTPDGIWAMKLFAKDGNVAFNPSTSAKTGDVAFTDAKNCVTASDAPLAPADLSVPVQPLPITVENVSITTASQ